MTARVAERPDAALKAVTGERFDVVVIGGGITGAGVALDAASRGYSVALVERDDYAIGTSSRSSKMVHGGLRYLQNFDLGLVREALLERQLMVQLAPHLVYPTPFLVPTLGEGKRSRTLGIGLNMYDVMATTRVGMSRRERAERSAGDDYWAPDRHRTIDAARRLAELVPALADREPREAYMFYDCQTDDVRLVLTILGEAERYGAVFVNGAEVTGLLDRDGRAAGVACVDAETGERFEVEADNVVNATGVWADRIRPEEIHDEAEVPRIAPSRGTHVTVSLDKLAVTRAACVVPAGEDRTIFALPWYGRALIGTTDNDYDGDIAHVQPGADDIEYLLDAVNSFFGVELGIGDLTGAYAGVRPLISTGDPRKSVDISRKAELYETSSGMLTITGGKLTTWRRMAKQVVDRMVEREGRVAPVPHRRHPARDGGLRARARPARGPRRGRPARRLPQAARLPLRPRRPRNVLRLAGERPELAAPIVEGQPDMLAEAVIAARLEQARSVADVLLRRTRLGLLAAPQLRTAESTWRRSPRRSAASSAGTRRGCSAEAERWVEDKAAEGIDPAQASS